MGLYRQAKRAERQANRDGSELVRLYDAHSDAVSNYKRALKEVSRKVKAGDLEGAPTGQLRFAGVAVRSISIKIKQWEFNNGYDFVGNRFAGSPLSNYRQRKAERISNFVESKSREERSKLDETQ